MGNGFFTDVQASEESPSTHIRLDTTTEINVSYVNAIYATVQFLKFLGDRNFNFNSNSFISSAQESLFTDMICFVDYSTVDIERSGRHVSPASNPTMYFIS